MGETGFKLARHPQAIALEEQGWSSALRVKPTQERAIPCAFAAPYSAQPVQNLRDPSWREIIHVSFQGIAYGMAYALSESAPMPQPGMRWLPRKTGPSLNDRNPCPWQ